MESWNREYPFMENLEEELATSQTLQGKTELKRGGAEDKKVNGTYARAHTLESSVWLTTPKMGSHSKGALWL